MVRYRTVVCSLFGQWSKSKDSTQQRFQPLSSKPNSHIVDFIQYLLSDLTSMDLNEQPLANIREPMPTAYSCEENHSYVNE